MKRTNLAYIFLLLVAVVSASAGCGGRQLTIESGKLSMMGDETIAFLTLRGGKPEGFSAELAAEIAKRLALDLEVALHPFEELFTRLEKGECDILMSAVTITPEREKMADFSDPYFDSGQALLVPSGSTIKGEADLAGRTVGVLKDTTNQAEVEKIPGIKEVVKFEEQSALFDTFNSGGLDAVICDTPFAQFNVKQTGESRIVSVLTRGEQYGIVVKKGNSRLLLEINRALREIVDDGTYDRLYKKYFGKEI